MRNFSLFFPKTKLMFQIEMSEPISQTKHRLKISANTLKILIIIKKNLSQRVL